MTDSSASSPNSSESPLNEQHSRSLDARSTAPAQDYQERSFRDRVAREVGIKSMKSTSDALPRGKGPQLQPTPIPSTPVSRRLTQSELSPASPSVRRRLFSSPAIPLEFPDENRPPGCLGLGITGSPSAPRTRTRDRKGIVAGKEAQTKQSVSLINENKNPTLISDAKKSDRKKFSLTGNEKSPTTPNAEKTNGEKRKRKANQKRVRRKNQKKRMKIKLQMQRMRTGKKMELKEDRNENNKLQFKSSYGPEPHIFTATTANTIAEQKPIARKKSGGKKTKSAQGRLRNKIQQ
ncbi:serine-rich protein [Talaromyces pinophilus]|uniref:Serine-rich protein n=1 Tax=Talaromyces pinophilus TaxID=128442 RepID=A0A0B8N4B7_TALPI|nr:serine-rich protein [Talaromyces pinophilus]